MALDQLPEGVGVACQTGGDKLLIALGRRLNRLARTHE
jgi:hypothetical protein